MGDPIQLARPCFDQREAEAVKRVLTSGWVVQGPEVEAFEAAIAALHRARHCIAVSSGTAALHVAYLAMGIGAGDAVFVPSFAWPSAAHMAKLVGARPVFVDVLPGTYNLDPADLALRIETCVSEGWGRPRLIVPVHEFGLAADLEAILAVAKRFSIEVLEDAACALGATYRADPVGRFGRMGIFSFHPRKSITTGEGGAIITDDNRLAELCRGWRNHGQQTVEGRRDFVLPGLNYRLTEFQAAIGRVQLEKFPAVLDRRRALAELYLAELAGDERVELPTPSPEHTWQTFMVVLKPAGLRPRIVEPLRQRGIEAGPGSVAGHLGAHFQPQPPLPVSEGLHWNGLALPLYPGMADKDIDTVAKALGASLAANRA